MGLINSFCRIVPGSVCLNGEDVFQTTSEPFVMKDFFSAVYEQAGIDYRRFYKMDALSKLGFLASEILLAGSDREHPKPDMGIIFFNKSSSLEADINYQKTIQDKYNFFPSPADFVYTLPNIVAGEIAIRNKIYGETTFYVLNRFSAEIDRIVEDAFCYGGIDYVLTGWVDVDVFNNTVDCLLMLCTSKTERTSVNKCLPCLPPWLKGIRSGEVMEISANRLHYLHDYKK